MAIAVLALQGAFIEHERMLERLGVESFEIRQKKDLERDFDGLIIPGGESTVMGKLLRELDLFESIKEKIEQGMPVFGTCAGLILLAKNLTNGEQSHLGTMNITANRNAYGRQLGSFSEIGKFGDFDVPMIFIRAPYIESADGNVQILSVTDGKITAARQGNQLCTAFHPELADDLTVHKYFVDMVSMK